MRAALFVLIATIVSLGISGPAIGDCVPPDNCGVDKCGDECHSRLCGLKGALAGIDKLPIPVDEKREALTDACVKALEYAKDQCDTAVQGAIKYECKEYDIDL